VNAFLDKAIHINFGGHGKMVKRLGEGLTKMSGSKQAFNNKAANATVKGAVVAAGAMLAITSTIEVSRMVSGRISGMQCMKNIGTAAGGIAAGTIGATIGGAALSFIPGIGTFVGSVIGGAIGGMLGSKATKSVLDKFIEDDAPKMLRIVSMQFEYFVGKYCLNEDELEIASKELEGLASKIEWLQNIFSKEGYRV
jgi:phage tail tape-measure protein